MWKVGEKNKAKLESILIETFWFFNPLKLMPEDNSNNSKCHQLGDNKCFSHCCVAVCIIAGKVGPSASSDRNVGAKPEKWGRSHFFTFNI